MRVLGLILTVLGWFIAVGSTQISGTGLQLFVALLGLSVSLAGLIGVLNRTHLESAIWKS